MATVASRPTALVHALESLGWALVAVDSDSDRGTARVCLKSTEGRVLTLDRDHIGRLTLTREQQRATTATVGRKGDRSRVDRVETEFLGRMKFTTPDEAFHYLSGYLVDNGNGKQLPSGIIRLLIGA